MERVERTLDVRESGAVVAVQKLLWRLMEEDVVQGLLVPLQAHPHEAPAPTLIKTRERLDKANPLAPVMTLNSAKIVGLLLAQESGKRLAAVMRPCEVRALVELSRRGEISLDDLVTISIDCLGSHDEEDYEQRAALWGGDVPTRESLRWSRRGQIAPYRFRRACQICERPYYDQADISIGLFGQNVNENVLVFVRAELADRIGFGKSSPGNGNVGWSRPATETELKSRQQTIDNLVAQRHKTRQRLLDEVQQKTAELSGLLTLFSACLLCGDCQDGCPLFEFDVRAYEDNTPEYVAARVMDLIDRAETCAGCGMCEAACHLGIPLTLLIQMLADRAQVRQDIIAAFAKQAD